MSLWCWHKKYNDGDDDNFFYYHNTSLRYITSTMNEGVQIKRIKGKNNTSKRAKLSERIFYYGTYIIIIIATIKYLLTLHFYFFIRY